jgi:SPP1 family predicted phage head-tail adaptor
VEILTPTTTRDAAGGPVETWAVSQTRWCRREDVGGREIRVAGQLRQETTAIFTLRWFDGFPGKSRLRQEDRTWDVIIATEVGRRQFLKVQAKERIGQ